MVVLAALTGCASGARQGADASGATRVTRAASPTPSVAAAPSGTAARARRQLAALPVVARRPTTGYARSAFGSSWRDIDHNGCNQRDDVLLRDAVPGTVRYARQGACDHDVLAGTWHDPYTGRTLVFDDLKDLHQAQAVQIDHIVPLAEAWASGADVWSAERRQRFANYLPELLAVDGPTNAGKGDGDPAAWRPRKAFQCTYAIRWIAIKTRWHLAADPSEEAALRQLLGYC
ncbi:HNH endonuclease [Nocardioides mangrovicus]|uniref:HNH endonuclease n=2 Tax=Nocardioides mangrovicus TaxID=2478913 RepID=A0A3L8P7U3_9ACTN|nr:HNH endonuclease [Nocardioides mangrovicus]